MKHRKLLFILVLLTFSVLNYSSSTISHEVEINSSVIRHIDTITQKKESAVQPQEYVLFAENDQEYNQFLDLNPVRIYPHLRAVIVELGREAELFQSSMYGRIFPASAYEKFSPIISPPSNGGSITLDNGKKDADILDVTRMWDAGYNGSGSVVAVFDNGISATHPGLEGQVLQQVNFNKTPGNETYSVCRDHGTPVSGNVAATGKLANGTIDQEKRGMAYGAKLIGVNVGCVGGLSIAGDWFGAFDWILANNATIDVVNTSWGGGLNTLFYPIITKMAQANIILVGSAGNEGPDENTVGGPGSAPEAISVGSVDYGGGVSRFSSRGTGFQNQMKPDLLAPGNGVESTLLGDSYGLVSGTSFSSPLTAGAIATLISGLRANGVPYNLGVIKGALMNNASIVAGTETATGHGVVQVYKAFENILNAPKAADNVSQIVEMSPRFGTNPIDLYKNIPRGLETKIPITLISSHLGDVVVSFTGNLGDILSFNHSTLDALSYSQFLSLDVNTTGVAFGTYTGEVVATLGSVSVSATYSISITKDTIGKILMDQRHTYWDSTGADVIGGSNTGEFIKLAFDKGIWVDEYDGLITTSLLSSYDTLWIPDPLDVDLSDPNDPEAIRAENFTQSEIGAIVSFVDGGGSLFVDFNGYDDDPSLGPVGTDPFRLNELISNFDINASTTPIVFPDGTSTYNLINQSSPVGSARYLSHFGNFLNVYGDARPVAVSGSQVSTAIWDPVDKGRVMITSTNFWMDNSGATGGYAAGQDDVTFVKNTLDWLVSKTRVKLLDSTINDTTITGKYQILNDGVPASTSPKVERLAKGGLTFMDITPTSLGNGVFEFNYSINEDGVHSLQIAQGGEYAAWSATLDKTPPVFTADTNNPNGTNFEPGKSVSLKFVVSDNISSLGAFDISFELDGAKPASSKYIIGYNSDTKTLTLIFNADLFTESADHVYVLTMSVDDDAGNTANYVYTFTVSLEETSTSTTTTPSPVETSTTEPSPFAVLPLLISFLALAWSSKQRKE